MKMDKKPDSSPPPPPPPPSVGDYDDSQSTYTVDQPPPAYRKPELPAIKLAKIVAATILLVTFIIGLTSVAIVYMQHNMKCAETVVVTKSSSELPDAAKLAQQETSATVDDEDDGGMRPPSTTSGGGDDEEDVGKFMFPNMMAMDGDDDKLKRLNFPIHIDMDELTGKMMENNQRARLNCVIEKKRSEEIIPRAPKTLQTPFGNLTTDPKFTHVTGETMSLTCRSGNDRVSRPSTMSRSESGGASSVAGSAPILIQIPLPQRPGLGGPPMMRPPMMMQPPPQMQMRHMPMPQQQQQQQLNPLSNMPALLGPLQALHEIQRMHQQRQQQQQQQQQRPPAGMHVAAESNQHHQQEDQQQEQQRLLPQLARHFPMPLLPLPQISLHQMIPQLLDVHKQLQQERRREEQQQREAANNSQQQQNNNNNRNNRNNHEETHRDQQQQQQEQREREQQEVRVAEGRALSMQHDIQQMLQRVPPPPPQSPPHHPEEFFGRPVHRHQLQHLEQGHEEQVLGGGGQESQHIPLPHHVVEQDAQRSREDVDDVEGAEGDLQEQRVPQQQEQQQQQQPPPPHQEHMGIQLDVAPSFHDGPHIVPADLMMMSRAVQHPAAPPPAPFLVGSHNMQPRSSSRPRMKRAAAPLAGSCSCVCK